MDKISTLDGRRLFGGATSAYVRGRPDYPPALYEILISRCSAGPSSLLFEVGAGVGLATKQLLELGIAGLCAIEPDPRSAKFLKQTLNCPRLDVRQCTFEELDFVPAIFDIGVAATSFHWLEQERALAKVFQMIKPGGWWAMWWTHFGSFDPDDRFEAATRHLMLGTPASPVFNNDGIPFSLDSEARECDLKLAGFHNVQKTTWRTSHRYSTQRIVDLYSTYAPIQILETDHQQKILSDLGRISDEHFGGMIDRTFITTLYTAQRPPE